MCIGCIMCTGFRVSGLGFIGSSTSPKISEASNLLGFCYGFRFFVLCAYLPECCFWTLAYGSLLYGFIGCRALGFRILNFGI